MFVYLFICLSVCLLAFLFVYFLLFIVCFLGDFERILSLRVLAFLQPWCADINSFHINYYYFEAYVYEGFVWILKIINSLNSNCSVIKDPQVLPYDGSKTIF